MPQLKGITALNRVPTAEGLGLSVNPSNFTSCNMDFFSLGLLPVDIVKQRMRQIQTSVLQAWNSSNIDQALSLFDDCDGLWRNVIRVDKELQFNSWLFDGMKTDLEPRGFTVAANQLIGQLFQVCVSTQIVSVIA